MSDHLSYITSNIHLGINSSTRYLDIASAQAAYEQAVALHSIAKALHQIAPYFEHLHDKQIEKKTKVAQQESEQRGEDCEKTPIMQELRRRNAPEWLIDAIKRAMKNYGWARYWKYTVQEIRRGEFDYPDYPIDELRYHQLRAYLADDPTDIDRLALADSRSLPIYQYICRLQLRVQVHNALKRSLGDHGSFVLRTMSPADLQEELNKPDGGRLRHLRNIGKTSLDHMRQQIASLDKRKEASRE